MRPRRDGIAYALSALLVLFESPILAVLALGAAISGALRAAAETVGRLAQAETTDATHRTP